MVNTVEMQRKPKESRIAVRVSDELKARIKAVEEKTGIAEADIVTQCVAALLNYVEEHGEITFPLAVLPKRKYQELSNERQLPHDTGTKDAPKKDPTPPSPIRLKREKPVKLPKGEVN